MQALDKSINNRPGSDFFCKVCSEVYELKSQGGLFGRKLTDGAYSTMIKRLNDDDNPNLFLLSYSAQLSRVTDFTVIPKQFFVPELIEERKPLAPTARRAGWVGCNIVLAGIPQAGRIKIVEGGGVRPRAEVIADWRRTLFIRKQRRPDGRGWIIHVLNCIESLQREVFSIADVYRFEEALQQLYPQNAHIRPKLRQQLQRLRDAGYVDFIGEGLYRLCRQAEANASP